MRILDNEDLMKINVIALKNFAHIFSSYNVSILIFQKMINKYNKTFNKKTYTLTLIRLGFLRIVFSN